MTWYTDDPDFTKCFEKTVLVLVPVIFFWGFLPLEFYWLKKSRNRDVPWNWKNIIKFLIISAVSVLSVADLLSNLSEDVALVKVDIFMPLLKVATFVSIEPFLKMLYINYFQIISGVTLYKNKKQGLQASGHQFLFWFLCALCGAFQFRSEIRGVQIDNQFLHQTYLIYYPLVCAMFLVNFLPDDPPRVNIYSKHEVRW